jgi:squalene synthase HpnC
MRPHVAAVYAYARVADDLADEGDAPAPVRRSRLEAWCRRLHEAAAGEASHAAGDDHDFVFTALSHTIRTLDLPLSLFDDLVSAFAQDITTDRYASWTELLDYCRRSANPVGRLVLRIAGYRDEALDRSSDALCTALQLTNFWQDLGRDWRAGRLYVPREVLDTHGAVETDLMRKELTPSWMNALAACAAFTRERFRLGRAVCDGVRGRLRLELRLTWLGGRRVLDRTRCCAIGPRSALATSHGCCGRRPDGRARLPDGTQDELLLCIPRAAAGAAPGHYRRLGFLPRRGRRGGRIARRCRSDCVLEGRAGPLLRSRRRAQDA